MSTIYEPIEIVANGFKEILNDMTFVGGATVVMYLDSPGAQVPRPTEDVDCVVEMSSWLSFNELESQLTALGFRHDTRPGSPICRWIFQGVAVDIMPTDPNLLGFSNKWYDDGIRYRENRTLPNGIKIYVFSLPYFLASKLAASESRGGDDIRFDPDIEDILLALDGNQDPVARVKNSENSVREYIAEALKRIHSSNLFEDLIDGALGREGIARVKRIKSIFQELILPGKDQP